MEFSARFGAGGALVGLGFDGFGELRGGFGRFGIEGFAHDAFLVNAPRGAIEMVLLNLYSALCSAGCFMMAEFSDGYKGPWGCEFKGS